MFSKDMIGWTLEKDRRRGSACKAEDNDLTCSISKVDGKMVS